MASRLADDWTRFRRFLCMGSEKALYAVDDKSPSRASVSAMKNLIRDGKGQEVIQEIKTFAQEGRAAKYKPGIYALAICAKDPDVEDPRVKEEAYRILGDVCKIPTQLFLFLSYCDSIASECCCQPKKGKKKQDKVDKGKRTNVDAKEKGDKEDDKGKRDKVDDKGKRVEEHDKGKSPKVDAKEKGDKDHDKGNDHQKRPKSIQGRRSRNAMSKWYNDKAPMTLAMQVSKYAQRHGWSHRDVVKMAHIKATDDGVNIIMKYVVQGYTEMKAKLQESELSDEGRQIVQYFDAVHELKKLKAEDAERAAELIRGRRLLREHVPTWLHNSKEVWEALLEDMPVMAMIRNLGRMSSIPGLLPLGTENTTNQDRIIHKLGDQQLLGDSASKVHPMNLLVALHTYDSGKGGNRTWEPNQSIVNALESAFISSFDGLEATHKRYMLIVDLGIRMSDGRTCGMPRMNAKHSAAAIVFMFLKVERETRPQVVAYSPHGKFELIQFNNDPSYVHVKETLNRLPADMDPALGIQWAQQQRMDVDVFVTLTDEQPHIGHDELSPKQALDSYRNNMEKPDTKLVMVALAASSLTLADPMDPGMLDVAGFDAAAPQIINDFVNGRL